MGRYNKNTKPIIKTNRCWECLSHLGLSPGRSGARVNSSFLYSIARHSFVSVVIENGITNLMSVPAPATFGQSALTALIPSSYG